MMDLGHWSLGEGVSDLPEPFGFIYCVTNIPEQREYIGKKQCSRRIKRAPLKGKKRNRIDHKESDWKTYTGSCNDLNADIERLGKDKFKFTILRWCTCKWELAYFEAKLQFEKNVLLTNSYNGILNCRIGKAPKGFVHEN